MTQTFLRCLISALISAATAVGCVFLLGQRHASSPEPEAAKPAALQEAFNEVAERAFPSVVTITIERDMDRAAFLMMQRFMQQPNSAPVPVPAAPEESDSGGSKRGELILARRSRNQRG